jgi:hypothetical protein
MNIFSYRPITGLVRQAFVTSTIAFFCYSGNALALPPAGCEELMVQIDVLKKKIQELESIKTSSGKSKKGVGNKWDSLQVNASKEDITALLGKPGRVDKWKTGEAWYYPNQRGGEVDFDVNGKVTGWLKP